MIRQLLLSKYQYQTAQKLLDPAVNMSGGLAVSLLQDAVETLAWTTAKKVDADIKESAQFVHLWDAVRKGQKNHGQKELPLQAMMQELNKVRIQFKHYGVTPDINDAQRYFGYVEEFLRRTMKEFFDTEFSDVSLSDLILDQRIRDSIKEAEVMLSLGEIDKSIDAAAVAEYLTMRIFEKLLPEVDSGLNNISRMFPLQYQSAVSQVTRYVETYVSAMRKTILFGMAGHKLKSYQRFFSLTPRVTMAHSGHMNFQRQPFKQQRTDEDAHFCINYATEFAISVQDRIS